MKYFLVALMVCFCSNKKVTHDVGPMSFSYEFVNDKIHFKVSAPTKGWVAIGFNKKDQLIGTNLIMGSVKNGFYTIDDRYILTPGNHVNVLKLGAYEQLENRFGKEKGDCTIISFTLPINSTDRFHHDLKPKETIFLLLAYSISDDFNHHSIFRKTIKIQL